MSNSENSSNPDSAAASTTPLQQISPDFSDWQKTELEHRKQQLKWQGRTEERIVNRALDLTPEGEPTNIDARKSFTGIGSKGLIGALLACSIPAAALAGVMLWQQAKQQPPTPAVEKQVWRGKLSVGWGEDGELDVDVLDKDGNPVEGGP